MWYVISIDVSLYIYIQPIWLQMVFMCNWRSNWRHQLSELRDALGGHDGIFLDMHLEAVVLRKLVSYCHWHSVCQGKAGRGHMGM